MADVDSHLAGGSLVSRGFYSVVRNILVFLCLVVTRVRVVDRHKVPASGAFILAPIHRSNIDSPLASAVTRRRMRFMGKDSLWKVRPVGWVLSALGGFPVSRGTADREALKRCVAVLDLGEELGGEAEGGEVEAEAFGVVAFKEAGEAGAGGVVPETGSGSASSATGYVFGASPKEAGSSGGTSTTVGCSSGRGRSGAVVSSSFSGPAMGTGGTIG